MEDLGAESSLWKPHPGIVLPCLLYMQIKPGDDTRLGDRGVFRSHASIAATLWTQGGHTASPSLRICSQTEKVDVQQLAPLRPSLLLLSPALSEALVLTEGSRNIMQVGSSL